MIIKLFLVILKGQFTGLKQPDSTANTIMLIIIMAIVGIVLVSNILANRRKVKKNTRKKYNKYVARKTASNMGLLPHHVKLMERLVKTLKVSHPILLYSDRNKLDDFLKEAIYTIEKQRDKTGDEKAKYVKYIYEIKEIIEMHSRKSVGLRSTHLIKPDQIFLIVNQTGEKLRTRVVNNLSSAITCTSPLTQGREKTTIRRGSKVKVYFWRDNDSGYSFFSRVAGYDSNSHNSHIYLRHSNKLMRAQNRKHRRKPMKASCFIYPVDLLGRDKRTKRQQIQVHYDIRFLGALKDISARGCRLASKHTFNKDQYIKIDFTLNKRDNITAIGKVKNISSKKETGRTMSVVFRRISNKARNQIYSYIFTQI